ncbi:MAG TPA: H-X9-DG-CTERM domain-containing protein, partial [Roseimicrobium sp.]|nr:H-X9-DG-CTERM domain-containing protein [Roseimicrobium sp.]
GIGLSWVLGNSVVTGPTPEWSTNDAMPATFTGQIPSPTPRYQQAVRTGMLMDGAGTIVLTERIFSSNLQGHPDGAYISYANNHIYDSVNGGGTETVVGSVSYRYPTSGNYHNGMFNYLFTDGHVEFLNPNATLGRTNSNAALQTGMWTITSKD